MQLAILVLNRFIDICNGKVDVGEMTVMKDSYLKSKKVKGEFLINKIQDFDFDDVLFKYSSYKPIVDIVESIIGPNITSFHTMLNNKPPDSEKDLSRHPLHQDLYFFPFGPGNSIVGAWTAMERVNEHNGCLFLIPGSHRGEILQHDYPPNITNKGYLGVLGLDHVPTVNITMDKGDTVFFHPTILHGSGPNLTKGFRKAISTHYADSNCYFINVKGTMQEKGAKELLELAGIRMRKNLTVPHDFLWKAKARLIRGNPGNFQNFNSNL